MSKHPGRLAALGACLILGLARGGAAQFPEERPATAPDVNALSHEMANRVRHLAEDIQSDIGQTPAARHLLEDTRELAQAVDEFHDTVHDRPEATSVRQAFAGIDGSWSHLRSMLSQQGTTTPGIARAAGRVDQVAAQIRGSLGLNNPPPNFHGAQRPPTGVDDIRRVAHALASRSQALAAILPTQLAGDPNVGAYSQDANNLARAADRFHDSIDAGQGQEALQEAYAPIIVISDRLGPALAQGPPDLVRAWQGYAYADALIRQNLGLAVGAAAPPNYLRAPAPDAAPVASPLEPLADQLVAQLNEFLQNYAPTARVVPEGMQSLDDATRLRAAAVEFQREVAQGQAPNQLAFAYRDVDAYWQRLGRRVQRIAGNRTGPNINRVWEIGRTCEQLHRMLAMPNASMTFPPPQADDN